MKHRKNEKRTKKINQHQQGGSNIAPSSSTDSMQNQPPINFAEITPETLDKLQAQGITPMDIAQLAQQYGQPIPPLIQQILASSPVASQQQSMIAIQPQQQNIRKYPAMMNVDTYKQYQKNEEKVRKSKPQKSPKDYGYYFSDLLSEDILKDMKRTQGSFLIGVNLNKLFNEFRKMVEEKGQKNTNTENSFKTIGEFKNISYDDILEKKMGYRDGTDIPKLPEINLDRTSTFKQIIEESKIFTEKANAIDGKITPKGLLLMTRMLDKYKKNNAQWVRVATVLELIYKYLGGGQTRQSYFDTTNEIPILALMELEEFYNTDHIFMSSEELDEFKKNLEFYKGINLDNKIKIALKQLYGK